MPSKDELLFLAYFLEQDSKKWLVYYKTSAEIVGITDGISIIYELNLDRSERKKFAGNLADTLLDKKWKTIFDGKQFKIPAITENDAELRYIRNTITLPKIEENVQEKLKDIIFLQQETIEQLHELSKTDEHVTGSGGGKTAKKSSLHSVLEPGRRKRGLPTGLKFEDD